MSLRLICHEGRVRTVGEDRPVCRVRLEGSAAAVPPVARRLIAEAGATLPGATLAAEAALHAGFAALPTHNGAAAAAPGDATPQDAFIRITLQLATAILQATAGEVSAGSVHQMRVAVRRLRSALSIFRPLVGCKATEAVAASLQTLGARLGTVRDWDVFLEGAAASLQATLPDEQRLARLVAAAGRQRAGRHADLQNYLQHPDYQSLCLDIFLIALTCPWRETATPEPLAALDGPLRPYAQSVLHRGRRRLLRAEESLDGLSEEALHSLRKTGKRLRYAAEFFAPLFPGKAQRRFVRRMATVQERLGAVNDSATAARLLESLHARGGERAFAQGLVRGFLAARQRAEAAAIAPAWREVRKLDPFWE